MKIAYINNGKVQEFVQATDPALPGFTLEQRYSAKYLSTCVECPDNVSVGWIYSDGVFSEPEPEPIPEYTEVIAEESLPEATPPAPTIEERIAALEAATITMMMMGSDA